MFMRFRGDNYNINKWGFPQSWALPKIDGVQGKSHQKKGMITGRTPMTQETTTCYTSPCRVNAPVRLQERRCHTHDRHEKQRHLGLQREDADVADMGSLKCFFSNGDLIRILYKIYILKIP